MAQQSSKWFKIRAKPLPHRANLTSKCALMAPRWSYNGQNDRKMKPKLYPKTWTNRFGLECSAKSCKKCPNYSKMNQTSISWARTMTNCLIKIWQGGHYCLATVWYQNKRCSDINFWCDSSISLLQHCHLFFLHQIPQLVTLIAVQNWSRAATWLRSKSMHNMAPLHPVNIGILSGNHGPNLSKLLPSSALLQLMHCKHIVGTASMPAFFPGQIMPFWIISVQIVSNSGKI